MTHALILAITFWLLFNLFLFAWLGPVRSAALWNEIVERLQKVWFTGPVSSHHASSVTPQREMLR